MLALRAGADDKPARDWKSIEEALGKSGELAKDGSFKVTVLRTDVSVETTSGMPVPAALGLNSYAAFVGTPGKATVVGDTCLLVHEVNPVIDALRAGEIEVVAIHNHMLADEPRMIFLHFQGHGEARKLAEGIRRAWDLLGKSKPVEETPRLTGAKEPDWKEISDILGRAGPPAKDGVYKVTLPRTDLDVTLDGEALKAGVGLACWAAFYACPCGRTMVMGDTCVRRGELQSAIDAFRKNGIRITGLHNHLLGQTGDVMFMHIEGEGDAAAMAKGVRAAWDTLAVSKTGGPK
ncbi:DUF1259 domain-containing protein [bacterium]|nr:DUF1259 domain-containing protein [bacterium]